MAKVSTFAFDDSGFEWLRDMQRQINELKLGALGTMLAEVQQSVSWASKLDYTPMASALGDMGKYLALWKSDEMTEALLSAQKMAEVIAPLTGQFVYQQKLLSSLIPDIGSALTEALKYSWDEQIADGGEVTIPSFLVAFDENELPDQIEDAEMPVLSDADQRQLAADIQNALSDKPNWHQRIKAMIDAWSKRNPRASKFIWFLLTSMLWTYLFQPAFDCVVQVIKTAVIREEPSATSEVIGLVEQEQCVVVLGEAPYYYYVEVEGESSDEPMQGYVSKRSVRTHPVVSGEPASKEASGEIQG